MNWEDIILKSKSCLNCIYECLLKAELTKLIYGSEGAKIAGYSKEIYKVFGKSCKQYDRVEK